MSRSERRLDTAYGEARLVLDAARTPEATLLLSHGAGNGIDTRDLEALAEHLPGQGVSVVRLEQPWKVAGRKIATAPPTLDVALVAAAAALLDPAGGAWGAAAPLLVGGRSAGARSAARCARGLGAVGCLALSFPLHPPGRPEKSRLPELTGAGVPVLLIQGERDAMGRPDEFPDDLDGVDLCVVPGGDHSLAVPQRGELTQEEATAVIVEATLEWIARRL